VDLIRSRRKTISTDTLTDEELHHLIESAGLRDEDSVRQEIDAAQTLERLIEAVQTLPDRDRLVFQLYYQDERSRDEIAKRLHLKPNAVDQALHRMRTRLRGLLMSSEGA
jgi:RNA polymerase sigma factor for flagellar operon FliA